MNSNTRWNIEKIKGAGSVIYVCYRSVDKDHPNVISCFDTVECKSMREARNRRRKLNTSLAKDTLRTKLQALNA